MLPLIIGIAGGTGCGKTTVAKNICQDIKKKKAIIIAQDAYYKDLSHLAVEERKKFNFDHPSAFDNQLLLDHLNQLIKGKTIQMPVYSFQDYTRKKLTKEVHPADVIILEGILVLEEKTIRDMLHIKIYVDTDSDERFIRRLIRDTSERGRSLTSVVEQYLNRVKPMFLQFVEPSKRYADIIIPQGGLNKVAIDIITSNINSQIDKLREV
ncbi:MAG: uridine kinase [Atribacterota bacterium]|nr:uridine kinase [Atribacterota bacterium]MDD4896724.1 uridine kinase [Atribacterota bacterium]MDD5637927.1 uridine kinase [Atribacterota bacterium]